MDNHLLFDMSYALMRRFAFIEVGTPPEAAYERLLENQNPVVKDLLPLRGLCNLGPAIYMDAARYARRRSNDGISQSRLLYETFYAFFLPQFEGLDERQGTRLYRLVATHMEPDEQVELRRVIGELLGEELVA